MEEQTVFKANRQQQQKMTQKEFLEKYAPQFVCKDAASELQVLREINSFAQKTKALKFNYGFDEESYNYYSKLQNVIRLELTEFRTYAARALRGYHYHMPGYYYELGELQERRDRPKDYIDMRDRR